MVMKAMKGRGSDQHMLSISLDFAAENRSYLLLTGPTRRRIGP